MHRRSLIIATCIALTSVAHANAQPRASERGRATQTVNGTTITFDFSRPVARGRTNLFGGVVHWGELWTPGANWATTLEVDRDVTLNGHPVPAGRYSVWMRPQQGEWTVYLNRQARLYHDSPVPEQEMMLSFTVMPEEGHHMEALAWYFPVVGPRTASVRMHWGSTWIPLTIETPVFEPDPVPAGLRARYAGTYRVVGRDPTTGGPLEVDIGVIDQDGRLSGLWGRAPIWLIPVGEAEFGFGFLRNGQLFDAGDEMTMRMIVEDGRAERIELLWEGRPFSTGERVR